MGVMVIKLLHLLYIISVCGVGIHGVSETNVEEPRTRELVRIVDPYGNDDKYLLIFYRFVIFLAISEIS